MKYKIEHTAVIEADRSFLDSRVNQIMTVISVVSLASAIAVTLLLGTIN